MDLCLSVIGLFPELENMLHMRLQKLVTKCPPFSLRILKGTNFLSDVILNSRKANVSWMPDDSGFYYTKNQSPKDVSGMENHLYEKVYFHRLGEEEKKINLFW